MSKMIVAGMKSKDLKWVWTFKYQVNTLKSHFKCHVLMLFNGDREQQVEAIGV